MVCSKGCKRDLIKCWEEEGFSTPTLTSLGYFSNALLGDLVLADTKVFA